MAKLPSPASPSKDEFSNTIATLPPLLTTPSSPVELLKVFPSSVPVPTFYSRTRPASNSPPPFANDPVRGPTLSVPPADIQKLNGNEHLSTTLLDYIIQRGMPKTLPDDVLIGSSNALRWFQSMNEKSDKDHNGYDPKGAKLLREKYQFYSLQGYQFLTANCGGGHFSVAWVTFDIKNEKIIGNLWLYDFIRRSTRTTNKLKEDSILAMLLLELQKFLSLYCFFGTKGNKVLTSDPKLILTLATHVNCPQQQNGWDCALFALGTMLHLLDGHLAVDDAFRPEHVTRLRVALYKRLTSNTEITWEFLCSFFPCIQREMLTNTEHSPHVARDNTTTDVEYDTSTEGQEGQVPGS